MRDRSITLGAPDEIYPGGGWDNGCMALEESVDLKLDHHNKDDIEIVDVEGEIDVYTAPRRRAQAGTCPRRIPRPGMHAGADTEDLPHHRADQGLRHPRHRGPGHRAPQVGEVAGRAG